MRKLLLLSSFIIIGVQIMYAQTISPGPGYSTVCPNTPIDYTVSGPSTGCTYAWTVTNGTFYPGDATTKTGTLVTVKWKDEAKKGTLSVTATCGSETHDPVEQQYVIHSLKDVTPLNPRIAFGSLPYCSTTPVNLTVDRVDVPNTGGGSSVPVQPADGYEWTLPNSQVVYTTTEYYTYQPINGCIGGTVSVRAYVNKCLPNFSSSVSINVSRAALPITVTPPTGYAGSTWCNQNGVTFTATSVSCFSNYIWSFPSGWTGPQGVSPDTVTTGNTITLYPSGSEADAGAIVAKVNLDCNTLLTSSAYNVIYTPPTTMVSGSALVCSGSTTYTIANQPAGITSISWSSSNTSLLSINSSTGVATRQGSGNGNVTITATLQGCRPLVVSKTNIWVGKPKINSLTGPDAINYGQSDLFILSASGASNYSWLTPAGWTVHSPNYFNTWITVGGTTSGTYNVYSYASNACPSSTVSSYIRVTVTGGGGGGCLGTLSVSPNPATGEVVINADPPPCFTAMQTQSSSLALGEAEFSSAQNGNVVITDQMGVVRRQVNVEGTTFTIDLNGLPNGIYIVKYISEGYINEARILKQ